MPKESQKTIFMNLLNESLLIEYIFIEYSQLSYNLKRKRQNKVVEELATFNTLAELCRYGVPNIKNSVPKCTQFTNQVLPNLDEHRFKQLIRVNWESFNIIMGLIQNHRVFTGPRSCLQIPIHVQLLIVLFRLGSNGEGASIAKTAAFFGIGDGGTIERVTRRVFLAILTLTKSYIRWPNCAERRVLADEGGHELPECIGYVDGTEIKLAEKPLQDPESYFSRKQQYSLKLQAVCDRNKIIRHLVVGWPGSVHDSRVYKNCPLYSQHNSFFDDLQWIAGDSAYKLTPQIITPFRGSSNDLTLSARNEFNRKFSSYRIRIEHCFALLKERFGCLKELKIMIKDDKAVKEAGAWMFVCAILHNIITESSSSDVLDVNVEPFNYEMNIDDENFIANSAVDAEEKRRMICRLLNIN